MLKTSWLTVGLVMLVIVADAHAEKVVKSVSLPEVIEEFKQFDLEIGPGNGPDPRFPSVFGARADGFTITGVLYGCGQPDGGCVGLSLMTGMPTREEKYARIIEVSVERYAVGFDAWVQPGSAIVVLETYMAFDGGVSDRLLPSTLDAMLGMIDQTKNFMLKDDPRVHEVWPTITRSP